MSVSYTHLDVYKRQVGDDLGSTMGNIIDKSYKVMVETKPDAVLVLGDTNSCLSVIGAKRCLLYTSRPMSLTLSPKRS